MCQISVALAVALDRPWPPDLLRHRCPDPVFNENVMYSAHLAQAATLYEAFSAEPSLSTPNMLKHGTIWLPSVVALWMRKSTVKHAV